MKFAPKTFQPIKPWATGGLPGQGPSGGQGRHGARDQLKPDPAKVPVRPDHRPAEADPRCSFLLRMAELLHGYGTPVHRLERVLERTAAELGVQAQFLSTPTSLLVAFGDTHDQRTHLLRVEPGEVDLGKLVEFDEAVDAVLHGDIDATAGRARLDRIAAAAPRFGPAAWVLSHGLASATAARFLGGGAAEIILSLVLGLITGVLARGVTRRSNEVGLFEPLAAFVVAFLAVAVARLLTPMSDHIVTLSALIVLLPGLTLTVAMIELATRHLVSGVARLAGAATVFLTIIFGVALARSVAGLAWPEALVAPSAAGEPPLPAWTLWAALSVAPVAFAVLFQVRTREFAWVYVAGIAGFVAARAGSDFLGPELGAFAGATVIGGFSNLFARFARRPASVTLMPGILLLVPGSMGFQSLAFFLEHDTTAGMQAAFRMLLVAVSLVGGLLAANALISPRRAL